MQHGLLLAGFSGAAKLPRRRRVQGRCRTAGSAGARAGRRLPGTRRKGNVVRMTAWAPLHGARECEWRTPDVRVSETHHRRHEALPCHAHDRSTACLVLHGGFRERHARRVLDCGSATLVWRPAGATHEDVFGDEGAACFNLEVAPELVEDPRELVVASSAGTWAAARLLLALRAGALEPLDVEERVVEIVAALGAHVPGAAPPHVQRAAELLQAHATEPWSLAGVAREVGLHPMHLARAFREA